MHACPAVLTDYWEPAVKKWQCCPQCQRGGSGKEHPVAFPVPHRAVSASVGAGPSCPWPNSLPAPPTMLEEKPTPTPCIYHLKNNALQKNAVPAAVGSGPTCNLAAQLPKLAGVVLQSGFLSGERREV